MTYEGDPIPLQRPHLLERVTFLIYNLFKQSTVALHLQLKQIVQLYFSLKKEGRSSVIHLDASGFSSMQLGGHPGWFWYSGGGMREVLNNELWELQPNKAPEFQKHFFTHHCLFINDFFHHLTQFFMSHHVAHPKFIFHILEKKISGFLLKYQYIFKK